MKPIKLNSSIERKATRSIDLCTSGQEITALPLCKEVVRLATKTYGKEHSETLFKMGTLAACFRGCGEPGEAVILFQKVLKVQTRVLGAKHPDTLLTKGNLGCAMISEDREESAVEGYGLVEKTVACILGIKNWDNPGILNHFQKTLDIHGLSESIARRKANNKMSKALNESLYSAAINGSKNGVLDVDCKKKIENILREMTPVGTPLQSISPGGDCFPLAIIVGGPSDQIGLKVIVHNFFEYQNEYEVYHIDATGTKEYDNNNDTVASDGTINFAFRKRFLVKPENLIFNQETNMMVDGVKSKPELNGMLGIIKFFDREKGRYVCKLNNSATPMALKPVNVRIVIEKVNVESLTPAAYKTRDKKAKCGGCGKLRAESKSKMECPRCRSVRYCNRACQKIHWKNGHKEMCSFLSAKKDIKAQEKQDGKL